MTGIRRSARLAALLAATSLVLTGCSLVDVVTGVLGGGPVETTGTTTPGPTEDPAEDPTTAAIDRQDVTAGMGEPIVIEGSDRAPVGSVTVTSVDDHTTCPNPGAPAKPANGKYVVVTLEVTADASLASETDAWYGTTFEFDTLDLIDPITGKSTPGGPVYACVPPSQQIGSVTPGRTVKGSVGFDIPNQSFAVSWAYGHQHVYVPPSVWGATHT